VARRVLTRRLTKIAGDLLAKGRLPNRFTLRPALRRVEREIGHWLLEADVLIVAGAAPIARPKIPIEVTGPGWTNG